MISPMQQLSRVRQDLGVRHAQLAEPLGVSEVGVQRLETSDDPRVSSIHRYAEALGRVTGRRVHATFTIEVDEAPDSVPPRAESAAWRVRAWGNDQLTRRFLDEGFVAIGGAEVAESLRPWPGRDALAEQLAAQPEMSERSQQAISLFVTYWEMFVQQIAVGDVMVLPTAGSTIAVGRVTGAYEWVGTDDDPHARHRRWVEWCRFEVPRSSVDRELRNAINAPGTLAALRQPDAAGRLSP